MECQFFIGAQTSIDTGDAIIDEAADILQLLHMEELRETQTRIITAIVAVKAIAADPKRDQSRGKSGRWTY